MFYNVYRPKRFSEVVGQQSELDVIKAILSQSWKPSAILLSGGYGCGKTTLARLIARALLCTDREGVEPCGKCPSCVAMDSDSNTSYLEVDSACLPPYAMVRLADGSAVKISTLVREKREVEVLSYSYEKGVVEPKKITNWFQRKSTGDFKRFYMKGTHGPLTCTPQHKLWDGEMMREASTFGVGESLYMRQYIFSEEQKQVIWGSLLGDSTRNWKGGEKAGFVIQQSEAHRDYFEWKRRWFEDVISADCPYESTGGFGKGDFSVLRLLTEWSPLMKEITDKFYVGKERVVPIGSLDELGPLGMAVWIMDDGSFNGNSIVLHTSGFSETCHMEISRWLSAKGFEHTVLTTGRGHRIVNIHKESSIKMGNWVAPYMESSMLRKIPEVCRVEGRREPELGKFSLLPRTIECVEDLVQKTLQYDLEVADNHNYFAADILVSNSHGLVNDIRSLKDEASYRVVGGQMRIVVLDESHMISVQGQNAMLQILEEGKEGLLFMFATTEPEKMLPTIRSRCVELNLKLLTAGEIFSRLEKVATEERVQFDERALKIIATYVRGHMRDALVLLEQLVRMGGKVTEDLVRVHLRLDKFVDIYELLVSTDKATVAKKLEELLCNYSLGDLTDAIGQVLVDTYKMSIGSGDFSQLDKAWMDKVLAVQTESGCLAKAEKVLYLHHDFGSINYGIAALSRTLLDGAEDSQGPANRLSPGSARVSGAPAMPTMHRKPGK